MKILLTGSEGFIGKHLKKSLEKNHTVIPYDKRIIDKIKNKSISRNINDFDNLKQIFYTEEPEIVIHLAAQSKLRHSINQPSVDAFENIIGSINLLECCKYSSVKRFIYASTGGARYGDVCGIVKEIFPPNPISPYGISKQTVERYLHFYRYTYNLESTVLCFGNVYGEGDSIDNGRIITKAIQCNLTGETLNIFGDGQNHRDYLYVGDLVEFITNHFNDYNLSNELINIGTGEITSVLEIVDIVNKVSGKETKIDFKPPISSEVKLIGLNCEKIFNLTGWKSNTTINEGIEKTFNWYKSNPFFI